MTEPKLLVLQHCDGCDLFNCGYCTCGAIDEHIDAQTAEIERLQVETAKTVGLYRDSWVRINTLEAKLAAAREGLNFYKCTNDGGEVARKALTVIQDDGAEALMKEQGIKDDIIKAAQAWTDAHLDGSDSQEVTRRRGYLYDRVRRLDQHQKRGGV